MNTINITNNVTTCEWDNLTYNGIVRYSDVARVIRHILYRISDKYNISYDVATERFWDMNKEFKDYVIKIFAGHKIYDVNSEEINIMKQLIKIPN